MKKNNFALLALAVLILGSCSQDETLVENPAVNAPIEFGICSGKAAETRAGITTNGTIQEADAGFGVIAGYRSYHDFMWNQQVTYVESSKSWTYDPVKYWPTTQGKRLSFYAYAPYQAVHSSGNVIEFSKDDPDVLLLTYNHQEDLSNNVDFVAARAVVKNTAENMSKNVTFNLKHELTRLSLYAKVSEDVWKADGEHDKTRIVITDVKLTLESNADANFHSSATYNYAQSNDENGTWDPTGNDGDIIGTEFDLNSVIAYQELPDEGMNVCGKVYTPSETYKNGIFILENTTLKNLCGGDVIDANDDTKKYVGNHLFLIPAIRGYGETETGITATYLKLVVAYEIVTKESDTTYSSIPATKTVPITSSSSSNGKLFEQGKAYTFTIIFDVNDVNEVKLGADAMDWAEVDEKLNVDRDTDDKVTP